MQNIAIDMERTGARPHENSGGYSVNRMVVWRSCVCGKNPGAARIGIFFLNKRVSKEALFVWGKIKTLQTHTLMVRCQHRQSSSVHAQRHRDNRPKIP